MRGRGLILLCACIIALSACRQNKDNFDTALLDSEDICLRVNGKDVLVYDPLACQLVCGNDATTFRVLKDDVSDYFSLTLGTAPVQKGQKISGCSVSWTTPDDLLTRENLTFQVREIEPGGLVWLWCSSAKIFALVRIL